MTGHSERTLNDAANLTSGQQCHGINRHLKNFEAGPFIRVLRVYETNWGERKQKQDETLFPGGPGAIMPTTPCVRKIKVYSYFSDCDAMLKIKHNKTTVSCHSYK